MGLKNGRIHTEHISFSYVKGMDAIHDLSLSVADKKITALVGANGCGKSTLFHLLTGRLKPSQGKIFLDNKEIGEIKRREFAKQIAIVHQHNTAPDDLTVRKLVSLGRTPYQNVFSYGQGADDINAVDNALEITDTAKYAGRMISKLSGGQRQRVWLAMALAQSANVLLLDEITTYLDIHYQLEILNLIRKLNTEHNITVLMVLHDINHALEFSDDIIVMSKGKLIASGVTNEVVTESLLNNAFHVDAHIKSIDGKRYCIFNHRK